MLIFSATNEVVNLNTESAVAILKGARAKSYKSKAKAKRQAK